MRWLLLGGNQLHDGSPILAWSRNRKKQWHQQEGEGVCCHFGFSLLSTAPTLRFDSHLIGPLHPVIEAFYTSTVLFLRISETTHKVSSHAWRQLDRIGLFWSDFQSLACLIECDSHLELELQQKMCLLGTIWRFISEGLQMHGSLKRSFNLEMI